VNLDHFSALIEFPFDRASILYLLENCEQALVREPSLLTRALSLFLSLSVYFSLPRSPGGLSARTPFNTHVWIAMRNRTARCEFTMHARDSFKRVTNGVHLPDEIVVLNRNWEFLHRHREPDCFGVKIGQKCQNCHRQPDTRRTGYPKLFALCLIKFYENFTIYSCFISIENIESSVIFLLLKMRKLRIFIHETGNW